jgi:hypothetical protein
VDMFFADGVEKGNFKPLTVKARRMDRGLHRLLGKPYPYILPGRIRR